MSAIAFDTHRFVKRLVEAGMPDKQAEVLAEEQATLIENNLATKQDLERGLRELEHRLTIRLGGMLVTGIAVVAALVKLL